MHKICTFIKTNNIKFQETFIYKDEIELQNKVLNNKTVKEVSNLKKKAIQKLVWLLKKNQKIKILLILYIHIITRFNAK